MFGIDNTNIKVCKEAFARFVGTGLYVHLFIISIIYVIVLIRRTDAKDRNIKFIFGIYSIIVLGGNENDI